MAYVLIAAEHYGILRVAWFVRHAVIQNADDLVMVMKRASFLLLAVFFIFAGCGKVSEKTLKEVLKKDPSFKKALDTKRQVNSKALSLRNAYFKDAKVAKEKIRVLQKGLKTKKDEMNTRISSIKNEIMPKIHSLRMESTRRRSEYRLTAKELKNLLSKLKTIRKFLQKKGELSLTGDEISIWKKKAGGLENRIRVLRKELNKLQTKIRILKTEIRILKE